MSEIFKSHYINANRDEESQKMELLEAAAKIIKCDIKLSIQSEKDFYPSSDTLCNDKMKFYIPDSLYTFLATLTTGVKGT